MRTELFVAAMVLVSAGTSASAATTITANTTTSYGTSGAGTWQLNDNRLRAYTGSSGEYLDGYMKFDVSFIPDDAVIETLVLTTYHEAGFSNPFGSPTVGIHEVLSDTWTRSTGNPTLGALVSPIYNAFPVGDLVAFNWILDPSLINWSAHKADNALSLAMNNTNTNYSYVYFYGSDNAASAPKLTFTFGTIAAVPEPSTWAMMIFGFGAVGFSMRRARRVKALYKMA